MSGASSRGNNNGRFAAAPAKAYFSGAFALEIPPATWLLVPSPPGKFESSARPAVLPPGTDTLVMTMAWPGNLGGSCKVFSKIYGVWTR